MRCYNNDILGHKASVFSWLCTAASPMATLHAVLWLSNSHCRCIQIAYCIAWILQFSLCSSPPPPTLLPCLSLRGYLHTFHPTQTVFVGGLVGNGKPTPRQSTVDCLHPFVVKGFCEFGFLRSLTVCHYQHGFGWGATFREFGKWRHLWTAGEAVAFPHKANVRLLKLALMVLQETHLLLLSNSQLFPSSQLSWFLTRHII